VLTGVGTCMAPALATIVLLAVLLTRRRRKDRQWRKAMPAMAEVWQAAWFYGRCGGAFLDSPTVPPELSRRLVPPTKLPRHRVPGRTGLPSRYRPHRHRLTLPCAGSSAARLRSCVGPPGLVGPANRACRVTNGRLGAGSRRPCPGPPWHQR
jgi:hypothetical protein